MGRNNNCYTNQLKCQLNNLQQRYNALNQRYNNLVREKAKLDKQLANTQNVIAGLRRELATQKSTATANQKANQELRRQLENSQRDQAFAESRLNQLRKELITSQHEQHRLAEENESLRRHLENSQRDQALAESRLSQLRKELITSQQEQDRLTEENENLRKILASETDEAVVRLRDQLAQTQHRLGNSQRENAEFRVIMQEQKECIQGLKHEHNKKRTKYETKKLTLKNEMAESRRHILEYQKELKESKLVLNKQEKDIAALESQIEKLLEIINDTNDKTPPQKQNNELKVKLEQARQTILGLAEQLCDDVIKDFHTTSIHTTPVPKKISSAQRPGTTSIPTNIKMNHSKDTSGNVLLRYKTRGNGDCAFHAVFGQRDEKTGKFICADVALRRKQLADAIRNCGENDSLFEMIKPALMELLRETCSVEGKTIQAARQNYRLYLKASDEVLSKVWLEFEKVVNKYPSIIEHINTFTKDYIDNYEKKKNQQLDKKNLEKLLKEDSLRERFSNCLNEEDDEFLVKKLDSIPELKTVYDKYKASCNNSVFDINLSNEILNEYADFIEKPGQSLLRNELNLIAHVFRITICLHHQSKDVNLYNPGQAITRHVYFNGINHYERMERSIITPLFQPGFFQPRSALSAIQLGVNMNFSSLASGNSFNI